MLDALAGQARSIVVASMASENEHPYNMPLFVRFELGASAERMCESAQRVIDSTPYLWRTFERSARTLYYRTQDRAPEVESLKITEQELSQVATARRLGTFGGNLIKVAWCQVSDAPHDYLFINAHHALLDGMSMSLLIREILAGYETGESISLNSVDVESCSLKNLGSEAIPDSASEVRFREIRSATPTGAVLQVEGFALGVSTFAKQLAVFGLALSLWLDCGEVRFSTAVLGRTPRQFKSLGSFARLESVYFDYREPANCRVHDVRDMAEREALRLFLVSAGTLSSAGCASTIVFDYKTDELLPELIYPSLGASIVEDSTYVDAKFDLHFSVLDSPSGQKIMLQGDSLTPAQLLELVYAYRKAQHILELDPAYCISDRDVTWRSEERLADVLV